MKYIKRTAEQTLRKYLRIFPAVGLTGPRQSGKSTMLINTLGDKYEYVTFDDINNIDFFHKDPEGFFKRFSKKTIFDEVQFVPEIFSYLKIKIDSNRSKKGQYVLTGSSNFNFLRKVSESLAGRIGLLTLLPFEYSEVPEKFRNISKFKGSYPELSTLNYRNIGHWYSSYINTYLEKDLRSLSNIGDLRDFLTFIKILAARTSQILVLSDISKELGISVTTVKRWISILEASYIIFLLPPYYKNLGKRLIKSPKLYFYDTGLSVYLSGLSDTKLENSPFGGIFFENYVISELIKKSIHNKKNSEFYFIRTSNGVEVDLLENEKGKNTYYEIKSSATMKQKFTDNIRRLKSKAEKGLIVYEGKDFEYGSNIKFMNYKSVLLKYPES